MVVLPLSRYSRFCATSKFLEGRVTNGLNLFMVQEQLLRFGIPLEREKPVQIVFCRDMCQALGNLPPEMNRNYRLGNFYIVLSVCNYSL